MKKYIEIFRTNAAYYLAYRLSFILWRVRQLMSLFITFFLWSAIFEKNVHILGYTKETILSYILLSSVISGFTIATRTGDVSTEIIQGDIINYLTKPVSFFNFQLARDFADKMFNFSFAIFEILLVIFLFKPPIFIQRDIWVYPIFFFFILIGAVIAFFLNISISFIAFWTTEVWAPRFILYIFLPFMAGSYFPLDILPRPIYYLVLATPFPYLYYLPAKIYLSGVDPFILFEMGLGLLWVFISYKMALFLWNRGIKSYSFFGR